MVVLGLGDAPQIAVGFLLAVVAVLINALNGLDRMPPVLLKVARMHRLNAIETAWKIRLPFAAPYLFTGFKLAVAYAFVGVVVAAWQLLYWVAGDVALTSPAATFAQLGGMLQDPRFLPHVRETMLAFAQGFAIAVVLGLAIGTTLGAHRLTGEVAEPILVSL